jgi:chorismate mutase
VSVSGNPTLWGGAVFAEEGVSGMPKEMESLRDGIDAVDEEIVRRLDERARLARRIGEIKLAEGLEAYVPARERKVLDRVSGLSRRSPTRRHGSLSAQASSSSRRRRSRKSSQGSSGARPSTGSWR